MISHITLYQIQYLLYIFIYLIERFYYKYIINKDIVTNLFSCIKYDNIHSLYILYLIFNIQIYTIQFFNKRIIKIYYQNKLISNVLISNETNLSNTNKKILTLEYIDKYFFINILEIYNCGIIYHTTLLFTHIYNFLGDRRVLY